MDTTTTSEIRLDDEAAHRRAIEHAILALGLDAEPCVVWDLDHHLQGHLDISGRHLVLIAARTDRRAPRLLTEDGWDWLRHSRAA